MPSLKLIIRSTTGSLLYILDVLCQCYDPGISEDLLHDSVSLRVR
jgi:hypothetical protein